MKRLKLSCASAIALVMFSSSITTGQIKWAQTGFNFLSVTSDARAAAMGEAVNSLSGFSGALSHNPATMANMPTLLNATVSVNSWIADIRYLSFSLMVSPYAGDYGVLGLSFQSVDYGEMQGTMVAYNFNGYIDTEVFSPSAFSVGIGYAKMISNRFGVGGQVRFAYQSLGRSIVPSGDGTKIKRNLANTTALDFGTYFNTGIKSLAFGMSVRNFSKEVTYEEEGFQLPLLFTIGISANLFDFIEVGGPVQSLLLSVDATHPRSHPEQLKFGMEYVFMNFAALRAGYITNNSEDGFTFGLGVLSEGLDISSINFAIDYSYTPFGVLGNVQRITARISK